MRNVVKVSLLLFNSILLNSCISNGYIRTLYSVETQSKMQKNDKVILVNPNFTSYYNLKRLDEKEDQTQKLRPYLVKAVEEAVENRALDFQVLSSKNNAGLKEELFSELLPLRRVVFSAIRNQSNPLNKIHNAGSKNVASQQFIINTFIPLELADLSKKYKTPYFGFIEIFSSKKEAYIIQIIVDVSIGIVAYQEIKNIGGSVNKRMFYPLMFDSISFFEKIILNKNI